VLAGSCGAAAEPAGQAGWLSAGAESPAGGAALNKSRCRSAPPVSTAIGELIASASDVPATSRAKSVSARIDME
jgi:hypothetical protein